MIRLTCPACNATLEIEDEGAGWAQSCPACQAPVSVPATKPSPALRVVGTKPRSTAVLAGGVCLGISAVAFIGAAIWLQRDALNGLWVLGIGLPFLAVALICSVVAMCSNQVWQGLAVLVGVVAVLALSGVAATKAYQRASQQASQGSQQQLEKQLEELLKQLTQ